MRRDAGQNRGDAVEKRSTQSPVAARQDPGFGPGSTPDYNVTLGLFLPFFSRDPLL